MLTGRHGDRLDTWIAAVEADDLLDLSSFAAGLRRDHTAVACLTVPSSSGPVEGDVNRIKMLNDRCTAARASIRSANASSSLDNARRAEANADHGKCARSSIRLPSAAGAEVFEPRLEFDTGSTAAGGDALPDEVSAERISIRAGATLPSAWTGRPINVRRTASALPICTEPGAGGLTSCGTAGTAGGRKYPVPAAPMSALAPSIGGRLVPKTVIRGAGRLAMGPAQYLFGSSFAPGVSMAEGGRVEVRMAHNAAEGVARVGIADGDMVRLDLFRLGGCAGRPADLGRSIQRSIPSVGYQNPGLLRIRDQGNRNHLICSDSWSKAYAPAIFNRPSGATRSVGGFAEGNVPATDGGEPACAQP